MKLKTEGLEKAFDSLLELRENLNEADMLLECWFAPSVFNIFFSCEGLYTLPSYISNRQFRKRIREQKIFLKVPVSNVHWSKNNMLSRYQMI